MMADLTLRQIVAYERSSIVYPDELSDAILNRIEDDPGGRAEAALVRMKVARPHVLISILVGTIRVASAWPTVIGERKERPLQFEGAAANARALAEFLESRSANSSGSRAERFSRGVESPGRDARWGGDHHRPLPWPNEPEGQGGARDRNGGSSGRGAGSAAARRRTAGSRCDPGTGGSRPRPRDTG